MLELKGGLSGSKNTKDFPTADGICGILRKPPFMYLRLKGGDYLNDRLLNFENKTMEYLQITRHFYSCRGKKCKETLQQDDTFYVCQSGVGFLRKSNRIKKY